MSGVEIIEQHCMHIEFPFAVPIDWLSGRKRRSPCQVRTWMQKEKRKTRCMLGTLHTTQVKRPSIAKAKRKEKKENRKRKTQRSPSNRTSYHRIVCHSKWKTPATLKSTKHLDSLSPSPFHLYSPNGLPPVCAFPPILLPPGKSLSLTFSVFHL
jgi:hypothetical protein